mmetsp:Transcript_6420/g.14046  ORF Transcript_6420/g.14046 Transcript_6420/m.14046 type:complete len:82 (+) Transcript_6420:851-1096(+)
MESWHSNGHKVQQQRGTSQAKQADSASEATTAGHGFKFAWPLLSQPTLSILRVAEGLPMEVDLLAGSYSRLLCCLERTQRA